MTTPERLRRRQRIEGTALLIVGILFAAATYVNEERDDQQEKCLTDQIVKLTDAIEARGQINAANTQATRTVILGVAQASATRDRTLVANALSQYVADSERIEQDRKDTKIPPFPNGKCD